MQIQTFAPRHNRYTQTLLLLSGANIVLAIASVVRFGEQWPLLLGWVLLSAIGLAIAIAQLQQGKHTLVADGRGLLIMLDHSVLPIRWQQIQRLDKIEGHNQLGIRLKPDQQVWEQLSKKQLRHWCSYTQQQLLSHNRPKFTDEVLAKPDLLSQQQCLTKQLAEVSGFHIILGQGQFEQPLDDVSSNLRAKFNQAQHPL